MTELRAAALTYAARGIPVFPCSADKRPLVGRLKDEAGVPIGSTGGFKRATCEVAQIEAWWAEFPNALIGVPTGAASGIVVLDLDVRPDKNGLEAVPDWEELSPTIVDTPSGGVHLWFRTDEEALRCSGGVLGAGVDVKGDGGYVIAPPSSRGGRAYRFRSGSDLAIAALPTFPAALRQRLWDASLSPKPGREGLPAHLLEAPAQEIAAAVAAIPNDDCDYDHWRKIGLAIWGATGGSAQGRSLFEAYSRKSGKFNSRETQKVWLEISRSPPTRIGAGTLRYLAAEADPNWRVPYDEAVEGSLQTAARTAHRMSADEKQAFIVSLLGAAEGSDAASTAHCRLPAEKTASDCQEDGAAGTTEPQAHKMPGAEPPKSEAEPWLFDPWTEYPVPSFPLGCVPAFLQSFVEHTARSTGADPAAVAMSALAAMSGAADHQHSIRMQEYGAWRAGPRLWVALVGPSSAAKSPTIRAATSPLRRAESELQRTFQAQLRQFEKAKEAGEKPEKPEPPERYTAGDVTVEAISELLSRQDRGLLAIQDELSGWIGAMDRYSGGKGGAANRSFWLQAYDGGPWTSDRIGRGYTYVHNCSVSILGGIQPARLAQLGDLTSDGLLQRFVPVMMGRPTFPNDTHDDGSTAEFEWVLSELRARPPSAFRFSRDALKITQDLRRYLFDLGQHDGLGMGFQSFVGKLQGVHGSIALLLHLSSSGEPEIGVDTARHAAQIVREFLVPNGYAFYQAILGKDDADEARALASYILTSGKARFVASDFTSSVRLFRGLSSWHVAQKASVLVAGGWLDEEPTHGGPTKAWKLRPGVRAEMATRQESEAIRKARLREAILELAKSRRAGSTG